MDLSDKIVRLFICIKCIKKYINTKIPKMIMIIKTVKPPLLSYSCGVARTWGEGSCYEFPISIEICVILEKDQTGVRRSGGPGTRTQTLFDIFLILRSS